MEEHRRLGGNTQVDVSYQYLSFLLDDDQRLEEIKQVSFQSQILLLSSRFCSVADRTFTSLSPRRTRVVRC